MAARKRRLTPEERYALVQRVSDTLTKLAAINRPLTLVERARLLRCAHRLQRLLADGAFNGAVK